MKNVNPFFLATGLVFLVCGYAWAGGSIEFLGNFSGGTVGAPTVFTGDNANGTGTVRIRPSDEDLQVALCEASNNASPEVCSALQHQNISSNTSTMLFATNMYLDSAGNVQRNNTAFGTAYIQSRASSVLGNNTTVLGLYNTSGSVATYSDYSVTGASAGTFTFGTGGTTTVDFRGPITNGGSATCNSLFSGYACVNDGLSVYAAAGQVSVQGTSASNYSVFSVVDSGGVSRGNIGYYGASFTDADYADKVTADVNGKTYSIVSATDMGVTTLVTEVMDNASATGVRQLGIYGGGTVTFPQTQTVTCADNGGGTNATQTLDPQAHTITILNNDATGCDVTMQETSAQLGAVAVICVDPASTATNVNLADVANVFNGAAPALGQGDCITIRYFDAANDLWLQTGASNN